MTECRSATCTISDASVGFRHNWGLDQLGNWATFNVDEGGAGGDGNWDLEQARAHNLANEIDTNDDHSDGPDNDAITETGTPQYASPQQDAAGNMTQGPRPGDEDDQDGAEQRYTYDAWNRLMKVERRDYEGGTAESWSDVLRYGYDGLNRRNATLDATPGWPNWITYHHLFSSGRQEIEMHKGGAVNRQFVWGLRYIDDLILRDRDAGEDEQMGKYRRESENMEVSCRRNRHRPDAP